MAKAIFYHAGCPVCLSAEQLFINIIDQTRYPLESVHLGEHPERINEAESAGIQSVPALLLDGQVYHINFGAALADLKS